MEELDTIIKSIRDNLSGDSQKDIKYLQGCIELYRDHPLHREISRACSQLLYKLLPEESRQHFADMFSQAFEKFRADLEGARKCTAAQDFVGARKFLEPHLQEAEHSALFQPDSEVEFRSFAEPMERVLYQQFCQPKKTVQQAPFPFHLLYLTLGELELAQNRMKAAQKALEKGLKWDPISAPVRACYLAVLKAGEDWESFGRVNRESFRMAFRPADLALCYENEGTRLLQGEDWQGARYAFLLSLNYGETKAVKAQLETIAQHLGKDLVPASREELTAFATKEGIPLGPNMEILRLAAGGAQACLQAGREQEAEYYLDVIRPFLAEKDMEELKKKLGY
jgi:hypothetical protein